MAAKKKTTKQKTSPRDARSPSAKDGASQAELTRRKAPAPAARSRRTKTQPSPPEFDVALSFAGEDRAFVDKTAAILRDMGLRVFYDKYEQVSLWGKDLYEHLSEIYNRRARYTVMFISKHYAKKLWTNHERKSAQARAFVERREYILPVRFDRTEIPGVLATVGYIDGKAGTPGELANQIKQKVGRLDRERFMPRVPDRLVATLMEHRPGAPVNRAHVDHLASELFDALLLTTAEERKVLALAALHSCAAGPALEDNIHLKMNLLERLTGLTESDLLRLLARLECLHINHRMTTHGSPRSKKDTIEIRYEPLFGSPARHELERLGSRVMHAMFTGMQLCPGCVEGAVQRLDFSALSSLASYPDEHFVSDDTQLAAP